MAGNQPTLSAVCPQCKHANNPRGLTHILAMTCVQCSTYFNTGKWSEIIIKFNELSSPGLPLGGRGNLKGTTYEVMGYVVKHVKQYHYTYREYTLFNPSAGLIYLSEYDGHWNLMRPIQDTPGNFKSQLEFTFEGSVFRLYQRFRTEITFAQGEFFSDVFSIAERALHEEYIAPPYTLSIESDEKNERWFKGEYISPSTIAAGFNIPRQQLPESSGRGYTQPFVASFKKETLVTVSVVLGLVLFFLQFLFSGLSTSQMVFHQTYQAASLKENEKMFVTPSFELDGGTKSLVVEVSAPISNDWFFGDFILVNDTDDTEYEFTNEIEYYSGVDDGYSWTEGSQTGESYLSKIPEGKYHLIIYPEFSVYNKEFSIVVTRDVPPFGNVVVVLILLAVFPVYYLYRSHLIERNRWSDSKYSPYGNDDE